MRSAIFQGAFYWMKRLRNQTASTKQCTLHYALENLGNAARNPCWVASFKNQEHY